ncbi:MAG: bifunctional UDP-N-acetylglucosamine diphosphorylase/glucosamine-1-phosphate N-acetyltransferase GlmU [Xanthomonadales bacterium]|nr:bifunctional UDP-N-acetylglucosamine diphosphorylase/glucosamine-1-phosphate N-acetyltransferase GlmU [Xanthomonadales bacterium]
MNKPLHIVILAAGEGTRMKSSLPKVLQPLGGRPMLAHLLDTARELAADGVHVVIGSGAEAVRSAFADQDVDWVFQEERKGTGHAVMQAMPNLPEEAEVLVLLGDHPLVPARVLAEMQVDDQQPLSILTVELKNPAGYGRVLRNLEGFIMGVVEHKDASPAQLDIREINTGIIMADAAALRRWLAKLDCDNAKQEYYLTGIFELAHGEGSDIGGVLAADTRDLRGANDRSQLARLERRYRQRAAGELMDAGVHLIDPERLDVRGLVEAGRDVYLDANVVLEGHIRLGDGVSIGPGCCLKDCDLAAGTKVLANSVLEGVRTTGACDIGPFARLRPGTELSEGCRIGNFVEAKNARLGPGSKASHLTYLGDSEIGSRVNIGAGTITCNYDGANKHRTVIEDDVFVGSNTEIVAPVTLHRGATIGAGSTITKDAPEDTLTLSRARQSSLKSWKRPRKDTGK